MLEVSSVSSTAGGGLSKLDLHRHQSRLLIAFTCATLSPVRGHPTLDVSHDVNKVAKRACPRLRVANGYKSEIWSRCGQVPFLALERRQTDKAP